jgi:hypothetical protein
MTKPKNPKNIATESAHISAHLTGMPKADLDVVMSYSAGEEDVPVASAVRRNVHLEYEQLWVVEIPYPRGLTEDADRLAWRSTVREAVEAGKDVDLGIAIPEVVARVDADGERAAEEVAEAEHRHEQTSFELMELRDAYDAKIDDEKLWKVGDFTRAIRVRRWIFGGLIVSELAGIFVTNCLVAGVMHYPVLAAVPDTLWLEVGLRTSATAVAFLLLPHFARTAPQRGWSKTTGRMLTAGCYLGFLCVAVGVSYLRVGVTGPQTDITSQVLTAIGLVVAGLGADFLHSEINELQEKRDRRELIDLRYEEATASLDAEREELADELKSSREVVRASESLRASFETACTVARDLRRREARDTEERIEAALGFHRFLRTRTRAEREHILRQAYKLRPADNEDGPGTTTAASTRRTPKQRTTAFLSGLAVLLAVAPGVEGCSAPPAPQHQIVVCDGTGAAPETVCTSDFLDLAGTAFCEDAALVARSTFTVVYTAATYGDTVTSTPYVVPSVQPHGASDTTSTCARDVRSLLDASSIPTDEDNPKRNRSNWLAALLVAGQLASDHADGAVSLVVASDGLLIDPDHDVNMEGRWPVPTAPDLFTRLEADNILLDLSRLTSTTWCGAGHRGLEADRAQARDQFVVELLREAGVADVTLKTTCAGGVR